jgi:hypothetical protein
MKAILKIIIIIFFPAIILSFKLFEDDPNNSQSQSIQDNSLILDSRKMDVNQISTWFRNNGSFNRNPVTTEAGFEFPKGSNKFARYASGIWLGAVVDNDTLVSLAEFDYEFLPGYMDHNGNPQGWHDPDYKIYVINRGDTISNDYQNWPVSQGAYTNEKGKPQFVGDQTMFMSFTDGYPEAHFSSAGRTAPLKADVKMLNWAYAKGGFLGNVIFTEYRIINRSNKIWIGACIGLWTDDDLGDATDDGIDCDSTLELGLTYNYNPNDLSYGNNPPAVGTLVLKGPEVFTGNVNDTAFFFQPPGSNYLISKPKYKNLRLSSFWPGTKNSPPAWDPRNYRETYNYLLGKQPDGQPWINPATGNITNFPTWIPNMFGGGDFRFMLSFGPFNFNPGDTQTVVFAQLVAKGISNLNSITELKRLSEIVKRIYELNFQFVNTPPSPEITSYSPGDGKVYLQWDDSSEVRSFQNNLTGTTYKFQGYNVYQIRNYSQFPSKADTVILKTYDIIDGVTDIYDSVYLNEYQGYVYGIVQRGSDNGISRYFVTDRDIFTSEPFTNGSEYKFAVTAYYYDPSGGYISLPKVIESPKKILKVRPQALTPGTNVNYSFGDTIITNQKDLTVIPLIFKPIDLITARYTSTFSGAGSNLSWSLVREINGEAQTLFENVKDFSGTQDTAKVVDGMLLVHKFIRDSGIVKDINDPLNSVRRTTLTGGWEWEGNGDIWFTGPDTNAIKEISPNALFRNRQFQSRSIGMSFPTANSFRGLVTRVKANGIQFISGTGTNTLPTGGPLRKIQIVFGQSHSSMAYRYAPASGNALATDSSLLITPFADMVSVPFSVFAVEELDSSGGNPRRLNIAFVDADNNGLWDPDTTAMGKFQITYIFTTDYSETPNSEYTSRNIGLPSPILGFGAFDIMYAWVPRVKVENGVPMTYTSGDKLTVYPYRPTRGDFVPGYPVKYLWETQGTQTGNVNLAATQIDRIKVFPNPYYGFSELEFTDNPEKMIYFSHLPQRATIFIYTLDGVLIRKIDRNESNPEVSLEKWDLKNDEGRYVASGMYIAYIDAKAAGTKVLKLAVFTRRN